MKLSNIIILLIALTAGKIQAEDMQKHLQETVRIAKEGNYQEALERHVWFHNHALEHQPSMTGVRLSFALMYWTKLGRKYPPALEKLKEIRNKKEKTLVDGEGSFELFHDVSGINRALKEDERTIDLFKKVESTNPEQIDRLWIVAKDLAFAHKEYALINRHIKDVEKEYRNAYSDYLRDYSMFKNDEHIKWVRDSFQKETNQLALLAEFNGDEVVAERIRKRAAEVLKSKDGIID
jgi:tetratricopeptide (TPR) repeat protein